ncbi:MAG: hypothetical protein O7G87_05650 [bacterium]|nr:hypothetical protein [bacterium]
MRYTFLLIFGLLILAGCASDTSRENEAQRMFLTGRDLEESFDSLPRAIARYAEIAEKYADTETGKRAGERYQKLLKAQQFLSKRETVSQDSLMEFYEEVRRVVPDYFALLKRLGTVYFNRSNVAARFAIRSKSQPLVESVMEMWHRQDQMWSRYDFRPLPEDRQWQDNLCKHSVMVGRMLQGFKQYEKALQVVERGLEYASGQEQIARAKVYAAFYTFRQGKTEDFRKSISLANEAMAYEFLPDEDRARAYHIVGLNYTYLHQDSGVLSDLEEGIKALNEAVNIDPKLEEARKLLRQLRRLRETASVDE